MISPISKENPSNCAQAQVDTKHVHIVPGGSHCESALIDRGIVNQEVDIIMALDNVNNIFENTTQNPHGNLDEVVKKINDKLEESEPKSKFKLDAKVSTWEKHSS